jgi:hypothetical protein
MKRYLMSLIVSGSVCATFTSALVVAQAPPIPQASGPDQKPSEIKQRAKVETKAELPVGIKRAVPAQKAIALGRAANLEQFVQQNIRQGRPSVRAELIFVRKLCALNTEQLRRINQDADKALKDAATKFAENQLQPRVRIAAKGANGVNVQSADGFKVLQDELALVMKKNLTPEQFTRYEAELEKRNANRRRSALHYLVDAMDRDLYLSDQQRVKLTESLRSHWDDSWCTSLEYVLYGNQFYPLGIDPYVIPVLDDTQKRVWQGTQKAGGMMGFGGVLGNFMNDNDALEEELAQEKKIEPIREGGVLLPDVERPIIPRQRRMIETKKAVVQDAPKNQ